MQGILVASVAVGFVVTLVWSGSEQYRRVRPVRGRNVTFEDVATGRDWPLGTCQARDCYRRVIDTTPLAGMVLCERCRAAEQDQQQGA